MFEKDQYELLDFGEGRKLEKFGPYILDRPCPVAEGLDRSSPELWKKVDAYFQSREEDGGAWRASDEMPLSWTIKYGGLNFELKMTDFGHVGLFPEHSSNWDWIARQVRKAGKPCRLLNLFAYTGGATLAAAYAGAEVVHVDAAQNALLWARRNTESSGLSSASIRWITEDVQKFVAREMKRGNKYKAVVLDPPTYGHGPKGEVWKIQQHLPELLEQCVELTGGNLKFALLSCHTTGYMPHNLENMLRDALYGRRGIKIEAGGLAIPCADGRHLPGGIAARLTIEE